MTSLYQICKLVLMVMACKSNRTGIVTCLWQLIVQVGAVLRKTVGESDWRFDNSLSLAAVIFNVKRRVNVWFACICIEISQIICDSGQGKRSIFISFFADIDHYSWENRTTTFSRSAEFSISQFPIKFSISFGILKLSMPWLIRSCKSAWPCYVLLFSLSEF